MTTILLVRHGETDWSRERRWQGQADTALNERGRQQARRVAASIEPVDAIYASDLARARETAEIVAERLKVPVQLDARLRERGFGAWEGVCDDDVAARFPDDFRRWERGDGCGAPDAEPYAQVAERVGSFVDDLLRRHAGETVLVVAHGGSAAAIRAVATGVDYVTARRSLPSLENCGLARLAFSGGAWHVEHAEGALRRAAP